VHCADEDRRTLFDQNLHADVVGVRVDDAAGADARLIETPRSVVTLDTLEILLEHERIEELVFVDDPLEHSEELRARRRCNLLRHIGGVHFVDPAEADGVDCGAVFRDRRARQGADPREHGSAIRSEPRMRRETHRYRLEQWRCPVRAMPFCAERSN